MVPSLNIRDLTSSGLFQTSGSIPLTDPAANLFFTKPDGSAGQLQFPYPAADSADFAALLESCKPASFGRGHRNVHDPNYRKALCLPPASLALSAPLQLPSRILQEIQLLLQPQAAAVTAALDKLNIYGPDGFFKSHVDTPRAPNMFGSMVMCLPTEFAGGELVLCGPGGVKYTQDWGSSSAESPALQWAAFYSDVEHEILPVTSGYRVTLTYNLYHVPWDFPAAAAPLHYFNAGQSLFGESLATCLKDGSWHSRGASLGFALERKYAASSRPPGKLEPNMLKGSDLPLYQALRNAGLSVKLAPLLHMPHASGSKQEDNKKKPSMRLLGAGFGGPQQLVAPEAADDDDDFDYGYYYAKDTRKPGLYWKYDEQSEEEFLAIRHGASRLPSDFEWAKPPSKQHWMYKDSAPAWGKDCVTTWGDYPHETEWWVAAVLVVQVPACGEGCRASK